MSKYTETEIQQLEQLCRELLLANEELNARCIAFNAKLQNEETKVRRLTLLISQLYAKGNNINDTDFL